MDPVVSGHRIPWFSLAIILAILLVTGDTGLRHGKQLRMMQEMVRVHTQNMLFRSVLGVGVGVGVALGVGVVVGLVVGLGSVLGSGFRFCSGSGFGLGFGSGFGLGSGSGSGSLSE